MLVHMLVLVSATCSGASETFPDSHTPPEWTLLSRYKTHKMQSCILVTSTPRKTSTRGTPELPSHAGGGTRRHSVSQGWEDEENHKICIETKCVPQPPPPPPWGTRVFSSPEVKTVGLWVCCSNHPAPRYRYLPPRSLHKDQLEDECTEEWVISGSWGKQVRWRLGKFGLNANFLCYPGDTWVVRPS